MLSFMSVPKTSVLKQISKYLLLFVFSISFFSTVNAQTALLPADGNEAKMQQYNSQAVALINTHRQQEAISIVKLALEQKENALSYYYLCHIYAVQNEWLLAVEAGEKAIQLDPNYLPVYPDLFYCYTKLGKWKSAENIAEQVKKAGQNGSTDQMLNDLTTSLENASFSKILMALFFLLLGGAFFLPLYAGQQKDTVELTNKKFRFSELFLLSGAVSCLFWALFFVLSHWIWSFNPYTPYAELTPSIGMFSVEHDGIETFVMYVLMFGNVALTLFLTAFVFRLRANKSVYIGFFSALMLACIYYFYSLGFIPPMMEIGELGKSKLPLILFLLVFMSIGFYMLYQKWSLIVKIIIVALLAYTCLVMIVPSVLVDMSFMLYPAVRMMNGVKIPDIYLQYDLYLSFVAWAWLKMNFSMESFPYIGQIAYFLFFVAAFFFTDKYFKSKGLSVLFIIAYVIIRYYAIWEPGAGVIQVSPARLDLWVIPMIVAYRKGVNHWLVGVSMGMLVLFHRNLGIIYLGGYAELLVVLFAADVFSLANNKELNVKSASALFVKHLRNNIVNIGLIMLSVALCFILFKQMFSPAAITYRKIGVGMIRISQISFYWYVPVVLSCLTALLFRFRERLGERYAATGLFIVLITIGESMYFFGRSHENGILTISGTLVLALFILFDILIFQSPEAVKTIPVIQPQIKGKKEKEKEVAVKRHFVTERNIYTVVPFLFVLFSGYYYSGRLSDKIDIQYNNFKEGQYVCPLLPMPMDTTAIRHITHNSPNVFFLDFDTDFYYYYYGHYTPLGYFNPCEAWIYRKDLIKFMQDLINKHYYVVYNARKYGPFTDYIPQLKYNRLENEHDMVAVSLEDVSFLIPETTPSTFHVAIKDSVNNNGMMYAPIELKPEFTLEVVVKPMGLQIPNASVINDFNRMNVLSGMILQTGNGMPDQYTFAFCTGQAMPSVNFMLENSKWHYLTITVNKEIMKVYDNGKLLTSTPTNGLSVVSNDNPFVIGNSPERNSHFRGYIREVRISNGNTDPSTIMGRGEQLEKELNELSRAVQ